jgi:two-component system chemotaxis sensor kinase CheA
MKWLKVLNFPARFRRKEGVLRLIHLSKSLVMHAKRLSLKANLLLGFGFILLITSGLQAYSLANIRKLTDLVRVMYDNPLMSSTFAQSAKFDFVKFDLLVREAMIASDPKDSQKYSRKADDFLDLMEEDLKVTRERTLQPENQALVDKIHQRVAEMVTQKMALTGGSDKVKALQLWRSDANRAAVEDSLTRLTDNEATMGFNFREESEKNNKLILILTCCLVGLGLLISLAVSAVVLNAILAPLRALAEVCTKVAGGDFQRRAELDTSPEIRSLASAFNFMLGQIEQKSANIRSLLGGMNDGLFFFDKRGALSEDRSKATDKIFPMFGKYENADAFLSDLSGAAVQEIHESIELLWGTSGLGFEDLAALLPESAHLGPGTPGIGVTEERHVLLKYNAHRGANDELEKIVVVAKDDTAEIRAKRQTEIQVERVSRITAAAADSSGFLAFFADTNSLIAVIHGHFGSASLVQRSALDRDLHTLKGSLALYQFTSCAKAVHAIETCLSEGNGSAQFAKAASIFEAVAKRYLLDAMDVSDLLRLHKEKGIVKLPRQKLEALQSALLKADSAAALAIVRGLEMCSLTFAFGKYQGYLAQITESAGNQKQVQLDFALDSEELHPEEARHLEKVLGHLVRNALDHGIEMASVRVERGKAPCGRITLHSSREPDGSLRFTIADDGAGIPIEKLAAKAVSRGIWNADQLASASVGEKCQLIFSSSFSTQETVSETSGRGVGLDAVKVALDSIGAVISVNTAQNSGTTFSIHLPAASGHPLQSKTGKAA